MSNVRLSAPKRRKGQRPEVHPLLPVPTLEDTGEPPAVDNWNYFTGDLMGDHVLVRHSGDIDALYRMGFFGKGNLSRNKPEYNEEFWTFRKRRRYGMGERQEEQPVLRVVPKRQYLSHLSWKKQQLSPGQLPATETSPSVKHSIKEPIKAFSHKSNERLPRPDPGTGVTTSCDTDTDVTDVVITEPCIASLGTMEEEKNQSEETSRTDSGWPLASSKDTSDWSSPTKEDNDPWSISDQTKSRDFWGIETIGSTKKVAASGFWGASQVNDSKTCSVPSLSGTNESIQQQTASEDTTSKRQVVTTQCLKSVGSDIQRTASGCEMVCEVDSAHSSPTSQTGESAEASTIEPQTEKCNTETLLSQTTALLGADSTISRTENASRNKNSKQNPDVEKLLVPISLNPLCVKEEKGGSLHVVDDSDDSSNEQEYGSGEADSSGRLKWIETQKIDPYPLSECLQLTFEEAFFLSYGLGCLIVLDEKQDPLDLTKLWRIFSARMSNFIHTYVAYHSLRSRGWVPKSGIKFGADFIIYHKGPPYYHGSYSVFVRTATEPDLADDFDPANQTLTWTTLMGMDRVTETVAKEPLLLLVIRPRDLTEAEVTSPNCVRRFKVQETLLRRWIPSKEREAAEVPEWL